MAKKERELPEVLEIPFVICDNTLNRKGWRLLVEGIDQAGFLTNPVCVVQHNTWSIPVGKWKNLKVENSILTGTVEFDRNDEEAVRLYWKYKDGFMNAVSLHVIPLTESEEPQMLVQGQKYPTIVTSELLEISLVTVPGQKNAVKLFAPNGEDYKLSLITNKNEKEMKVETEATKDLQAQVNDLTQQLSAQKALNAKNLIQLHVARGVVQDAEVEALEQLAVANYETVEKMLASRQPTAQNKGEVTTDNQGKALAEAVKGFAQSAATSAKTNTERDAWSYLDWFRRDPDGLALMAKNEPEKHQKLQEDFASHAAKHNLVIGE